MKFYKKLFIVGMHIGLAGSVCSADAVGGYSVVASGDKGVIAAAEFAVTAQQKAMNGRDGAAPVELKLVELLDAQKQVVSGINYRIRLKVMHAGVEKQADAVVWWQAWRKQDPYKLTRWIWDDGAAVESASPKDLQKWAHWIDKLHPIDDGNGNGLDIGSAQWAKVLSDYLGIIDSGEYEQDLASTEWRRSVERKVFQKQKDGDDLSTGAKGLRPK